MLVALGRDDFSKPLEASLREAGVTLHVVRSDEATGTAFICVSDEAENAITVAPGANNALAPSHLPRLEGVTHLLMQLETPMETVIAYAKAARAAGVKVVLNAAPARELPAALLANLDVLVVNEGELATVAGIRGGVDACLARIDVPAVAVTLGAQGSCARVEGRRHDRAGFAVKAVDTTAAGDSFCGALVAALARGAAWPEALTEANAAGALACTKPGAQSSIPTRNEVRAFLDRQTTSTK